jgi:hypothetical protein
MTSLMSNISSFLTGIPLLCSVQFSFKVGSFNYQCFQAKSASVFQPEEAGGLDTMGMFRNYYLLFCTDWKYY